MFFLGGIRWACLYPGYTLRQSINGVVVAVAANAIIPMRGGEVVRAFFLNRNTGAQISGLFGKIIIERTTDMISLLVFLLISAVVLGGVVKNESAPILALGLFACSIIYLFLLLYRHYHNYIDGLIEKINLKNSVLRYIKEKILIMLTPFKEASLRRIMIAQVISFAISFSGILLLFYFLLAANVQINLWSAIVIFPLVALSISLPLTIGHVGVYHAALFVALSYIGIDDPGLAGKVILVHLLTIGPPVIYGWILISLTKIKIA